MKNRSANFHTELLIEKLEGSLSKNCNISIQIEKGKLLLKSNNLI